MKRILMAFTKLCFIRQKLGFCDWVKALLSDPVSKTLFSVLLKVHCLRSKIYTLFIFDFNEENLYFIYLAFLPVVRCH